MNMRSRITIMGGLLAYLAMASPAEAVIRYVKAGATGSGASWTDPSGDLRAAMTASQEFDQVWVATGTYTPGGTRGLYFPLLNRVAVKGGFYADPQDPSARDSNPLTNGTVLSGDIGELGIASDNSYCVVVTTGSDPTTTMLDGFTITSGNGGYGNQSGAGIYVAGGSSPTLANLWIIGHYAPAAGAGVYVEDGAPNFTDCRFENNRAGEGAALYLVAGAAQMNLDRCVFVSNTADWRAAALVNERLGLVQTVNSIFVANRCLGDQPGGTTAHHGSSNIQYVNCLFNGNTSFKNAAAMLNGPGSSVSLVNCTVSYNTSFCGTCGGMQTQGTTTVTNCLFWGNTDSGGLNEIPQLYHPGGTLNINYSSVQDWTGQYGGTQNNGNDPSFVDPDGPDAIPGTPDDNQRLLSTSLCLDNGDNQAISGFNVDLDGTARIVNTTVDRGAYEYSPVDCNNNQEPDGSDIADCDGSPWCSDCNGNNIPDECDVAGGGGSSDTNGNGVPDECDIAGGPSRDCDGNGIPDEVEFDDCNENCIVDECDIDCGESGGNCFDVEGCGGSEDCNQNDVPDECELPVPSRWTDDDAFDEGTLINVNHDVADELQRNAVAETAPLPYLWVAASGRGTVLRIRTEDEAAPGSGQAGDILGEYRTAPRVHVAYEFDTCSAVDVISDPSRTTVDLDGSIWAANRGDSYYSDIEEKGSVVKIGLVIGGTRVDAKGSPDANGAYLAPPFEYCACEDQDGDGLIRTSRGLGDIMAWDNWDGEDDDGGVESAEDECIIRYVRVAGTGTRTVAIEKDNDVWVGGSSNLWHEKVDGFTGVLVAGTQFQAGCGGYGGLVDCNGVLWSARGGWGLLRYDTTTLQFIECLNDTYGNYGLGFDGNTGEVWHTNDSDNRVAKLAADGSFIAAYQHSDSPEETRAQGVAVDGSGHVWVAHSYFGESKTVGHLLTDGTFVDNVVLSQDRCGPTGVAVDANGMIWTTNYDANNVMRIDPAGGGGVGAVDLTVPLGDGAQPYNYSDMTGMVGLHTTGMGTWSVVHDGRLEGTEWCRVTWNEDEECDPADERLTVEVRAADSQA